MVPQVARASSVPARRDAAQRAHEHIGHGGEPQPQLVGAHGRRRRAVGEQVELALLDAVLHVAARAVDVLVEDAAPRPRVAIERGDDEARVGLALGPLGLADHAPLAAPALARAPREVLEAARRRLRLGRLPLGACQLALDLGDQPVVAGQPEHVIDAVVLAPAPSAPRGKARVGPQHRSRTFGQRARICADDARDLLDARRPRRRCWRAAAWPPAGAGRRRCRAAGSSSSRSSRGRSGPPDGRAADRRWHPGRARCASAARPMRLQEQRHEQLLDAPRRRGRSCGSGCDATPALPGACSSRFSVHLPASGAQSLAPRLELAGQHRQHRIVPQLIVIVEVLVAQRQAEDALADQRRHRVLDQLGVAAVAEAGGKAIDQTGSPCRSRPAAAHRHPR